jgi:chemotaxis protein methyltransferase CheR
MTGTLAMDTLEGGIDGLLEVVHQVHGYDLRAYARASLVRRMRRWLDLSPFGSFAEAEAGLVRDPALMEGLIQGVTVAVTEMFRDPGFFRMLREAVVPRLSTYPFLRIWNAGCATGEEAYSLAILLREEGLEGRFRIYATDINRKVLEAAGRGEVPLRGLQNYSRNYQLSGGRGSLADYLEVRAGAARLDPSLRDHMVFASHNLVTDSDFGEMNLILCRNVMIYFTPAYRDRALGLFDASLPPGGFLCLGLKESLAGTALDPHYTELAHRIRIYRKAYAHAG